MALVTICATAMATLIMERVVRKIYSEVRGIYKARIERPKKWVFIRKISEQYSLYVWNETYFFGTRQIIRARILNDKEIIE